LEEDEMDLIWKKIGTPGCSPRPIYEARSNVREKNSYSIAGTEGYWYTTFHDCTPITIPGGDYNLGWSPTLAMAKNRAEQIEDHYTVKAMIKEGKC
jgi:hypothetical protein